MKKKKSQDKIVPIPIAKTTLLDKGKIPVEGLTELALREGQNPRAIYQAHRWFARRLGSAFRGLLTAAATPADEDFWESYYDGVDLTGHLVLDSFVGGGTSVIEALRLNADVIGIDVDAVACAITDFETKMSGIENLVPALNDLKRKVGRRLASLYQTITPNGESREVLHYFWVQVVDCSNCLESIEAHPHYQLAYEAEGTRQWVFCPECYEVQELHRRRKNFNCEACGEAVVIPNGTVKRGILTCPYCQTQERLIHVAARTGMPPRWRLFAVETVEASNGLQNIPLSKRYFQRATEHDGEVFARARRRLRRRMSDDGTIQGVPNRLIPRVGRVDNRILNYGYTRYQELFNDRQLLHLSLLSEAVSELEEPVREAMIIAFSDHLTTNCMMTHYAFGWRRLAPLFSVRSYRHVPRPVEINPWMDGTGRGTFPNTVRHVQRAINWARSPKEALIDGGFQEMPKLPDWQSGNGESPTVRIYHRNSKSLNFIKPSSVSLALTDPPYFDNIAYSELSDFFLPWLQLLGLIKQDGRGKVSGFRNNLAAGSRSEKAISKFEKSLGECFREIARVLKKDGRLIFTYQHRTMAGWLGLANAIASAGLQPVQLFPLLGDGDKGLHTQAGSIKWDAVFVLQKAKRRKSNRELKLSSEALHAAKLHYAKWVRRLSKMDNGLFRDADESNFYCACLTASAVGLFPQNNGLIPDQPLKLLLRDHIQEQT